MKTYYSVEIRRLGLGWGTLQMGKLRGAWMHHRKGGVLKMKYAIICDAPKHISCRYCKDDSNIRLCKSNGCPYRKERVIIKCICKAHKGIGCDYACATGFGVDECTLHDLDCPFREAVE